MDKQARKAEAVTSTAEKPVNKLRSHRCRQTCPPDSIFVIYSSFRTSLIIDQRRNTSCDWAIRYRKNFSHFLSKHVHSSASLLVDGWVMSEDDEPLFWVPIEHRKDVYVPWCRVVIKASQISTILDMSNSRLGRKWTECIDKEWLRDIEEGEGGRKSVGARYQGERCLQLNYLRC